MKKATYILTIIILSLLSVGATVQAQFLEYENTLKLSVSPYSIDTGHDFRFVQDNPLEEYFVNIDGVIRIGDNSIKLKKKYQPHARIRIEVNKGRLKLGGYTKEKRPKYRGSEGKLDIPVDIRSWYVDSLSIEDKDITISIYDNNTGQLLEEKTYKLKPDSVDCCYYPKLCYTNLDGKEVKVEYLKFKVDDDIDYSKPMKIVVENIWGKTYKVCSHCVDYRDYSMHNIMMPSDGDTLTEKEKSVIRELPKGKFIYISDIIAEQNGKKYNKSPIEIRK